MSEVLEAPTYLRIIDTDRFNFSGGTKFKSKFIEPGIVSYKDMVNGGIELLRKETIDKCLDTAIGNPLTIGHVDVSKVDRHTVENGIIESVSYNPEDGWYYCEGTVDTDAAKSKMRAGKRPSCAYEVTSFGPGGVYHGIRYEREITGLKFQHLAIVEKPRYEDAVFRLNSFVSNSTTNMFKLFQKLADRLNGVEDKQEKVQEIPGETLVDVDGKSVRLNDLMSVWKTQKGQVFEASADDEVEVDGKRVRMHELVNCYRSYAASCASGSDHAHAMKHEAGHPHHAEAGAMKHEANVATHMVHEAAMKGIHKHEASMHKNTQPEMGKVATDDKGEPDPADQEEHKREKQIDAMNRDNAAPAAVEAAPVAAPAAIVPEAPKGVDFFLKLNSARNNSGIELSSSIKSAGSLIDRVNAGQNRYGSSPAVTSKS